MDWQTIVPIAAMVTGSIGAACGMAGVILNWQTRRDLKFAKLPIVTIQQADWQNRPTDLTLSLRSRSNIGYRVESVTVVRPLDAAIATGSAAELAQGPWARTVKPNLAVTHEGRQGRSHVMGSGDHHSAPLAFRSRRSVSSSSSRLITLLKRWRACSDSSHSLRASFIVRLIDENASTSAQRKTITLKAPKPPTTRAP